MPSSVSNMPNQTEITDNPAMLFQLLRFSSPSLPIGSFAWSQGLESAIELDWLKDADDLHDWLLAILEHSFVQQELPLLQRMLNCDNQDELARWNDRTLAMRESAELRMEDVHTGRALCQLACSLEISLAKSWPAKNDMAYITASSLICRHYKISFDAAATGFIWSWLDNQIAAAIKLFPLGQTAGQLLIEKLAPIIAPVVEAALQIKDEDIGISLPGQVMASMLHETQYSRMFRS